jgi:multimeric flavodoxin WrbA
MPRLLIVHHTPSPATQAVFDAIVDGATTDEIEGVDVVRVPALIATPQDAMSADGYLIGGPANIGMICGALKVFFDLAYYPCLDHTRGRPYATWAHGNDDTTGAIRNVETIATGLEWRKVAEPLSITGAPSKTDLEAAWELGATVAASLMD